MAEYTGASFDADAVMDNAHQLLTFLHGHCTRPGGLVGACPEANVVRVLTAALSAECGAT